MPYDGIRWQPGSSPSHEANFRLVASLDRKRLRAEILGSSKNGLPCYEVIGSALDNQGSLWLHMGCGLARIRKEEIDNWWHDDTVVVTPKVLDASDGVQSGGPTDEEGQDSAEYVVALAVIVVFIIAALNMVSNGPR